MVDLKVKGPGLEPSKTALGGGMAAGKSNGTGFSESVKTARRSLVDGELKGMLDQTRRLGDVFLKSPDESKMNSYKQAIKEFLERAGKELFSLKQEMGNASQGQQKVYQLIETVDREVDSLTRETLQKDKALLLLGSLDDIRGLVLDLIS